MIRLYKNELRWIIDMAMTAYETSNELAERPDNQYRELNKLHAENMDSLYKKIETALKNGDKRIEIVP